MRLKGTRGTLRFPMFCCCSAFVFEGGRGERGNKKDGRGGGRSGRGIEEEWKTGRGVEDGKRNGRREGKWEKGGEAKEGREDRRWIRKRGEKMKAGRCRTEEKENVDEGEVAKYVKKEGKQRKRNKNP